MSRTISRWGWAFAAAGGALWAALGVWLAVAEATGAVPRPEPYLGAPLALLAVGVLGFDRRYGPAYGRRGRVGAAVAAVGAAVAVAAEVAELVAPVDAFPLFALGYVGAFAGWALVGWASLRAGVGSRPGAALLVAALPAGVAIAFLLAVAAGDERSLAFGPMVLSGAAWTALGWRLRADRRRGGLSAAFA